MLYITFLFLAVIGESLPPVAIKEYSDSLIKFVDGLLQLILIAETLFEKIRHNPNKDNTCELEPPKCSIDHIGLNNSHILIPS